MLKYPFAGPVREYGDFALNEEESYKRGLFAVSVEDKRDDTRGDSLK